MEHHVSHTCPDAECAKMSSRSDGTTRVQQKLCRNVSPVNLPHLHVGLQHHGLQETSEYSASGHMNDKSMSRVVCLA
jgi:hypothetical protein